MTDTKQKPKMLFVDDRSKRLHAALRKYGDEYDVFLAPSVKEAKRLLANRDQHFWDVVSLDYDLNGEDYLPPESRECGMEIVRFVKTLKKSNDRVSVSRWIVHSTNPEGAAMMYEELAHLFSSAWVTKEPFQYD